MDHNLEDDDCSVSGFNGYITVRNTNNEGEKSNKCNQCDYATAHAGNLRTHFKMHSGEKPNKCNQCDYASSEAVKLRRHLKAQWRKVKQMQAM